MPDDKSPAVPVVETGTAEKGGKPMKRINGIWHYRGKQYATLHDALVANWPKK